MSVTDRTADLYSLMEFVAGHLESERQAGRIPGAAAVQAGDDGHPHPVARLPLITVDVESEDATQLDRNNGGRLVVTLAVRIYVGGAGGDRAANQLCQQIWASESGTLGVRKALLGMPPMKGVAVALDVSRKLREGEIPNAKFSAGWEGRLLARFIAQG